MSPLSTYRKIIINALLISSIFALFLMMAADMTAVKKKEVYYSYKSTAPKDQNNELNVLEMMRMKLIIE